MNSRGASASRRGSARPITRSLQAVAALVLAVIAAVTFNQLVNARSALIADAIQQVSRLDMVFAEQTGRAVETVDLIVRDAIETLRALSPAEQATSGDRLQRRIGGVRQMSQIAFVDPSGEIMASSGNDVGTRLQAAGLTLLAWHRDHTDDALQISEPLHDADGHWSALLSRRANDHDGHFVGIAVATLNLGYFADFYKAVELNENGAIMLHRRDGTVLARYPPNDAIVGRSYAELPPFKTILATGMAGTALMDSPIDGSRRVLAIRALKLFPLAVNVSIDESIVLAPWRREALVFAVTAIGSGLAIGLLLLLLSQRSARVESLLVETATARTEAENANQQLREQMTERERAEAALRQIQRMEAIGQLTGGLAHDFNNLLMIVLGNIDLIETAGSSDAVTLDRLATVRAAAERGAALNVQLLAFARRQPLVPRDVDVDALVTAMTELLQSALGSRITIARETAPGPWHALVDPTQLELVILNLAINARDAMPDGGRLTIAISNSQLGPSTRADAPAAGDYVVIEVADCGAGMSPEVQAKAFEPFFTTKPPGVGTGLGLSQVLGVARQSGGGVQIESHPGRGTVIRVQIPRSFQVAPATTASAAPQPRLVTRKATILMVDDDPAVRGTVAEILETLGYDVRAADGGRAALAILDAGDPIDLLLTDLAMPDIAGAELARKAWDLRPSLPVIFISGYADPAAISGAYEGRSRLIRKPFRSSDLTTHIEAALSLTELQKSALQQTIAS